MTIPAILSETLLTLPQAAARFGVTPPTVRRWWQTGTKGPGGVPVKLETAKNGGRRVTSVEATERFLAALNPEPAAPVRTPTQRRKASEAAERKLIAMGC